MEYECVWMLDRKHLEEGACANGCEWVWMGVQVMLYKVLSVIQESKLN